jgi:hypothetical protein
MDSNESRFFPFRSGFNFAFGFKNQAPDPRIGTLEVNLVERKDIQVSRTPLQLHSVLDEWQELFHENQLSRYLLTLGDKGRRLCNLFGDKTTQEQTFLEISFTLCTRNCASSQEIAQFVAQNPLWLVYTDSYFDIDRPDDPI